MLKAETLGAVYTHTSKFIKRIFYMDNNEEIKTRARAN